MQLDLFYCYLGLEEPTNDVAYDLPITRTLLDEVIKSTQFVDNAYYERVYG